MTKRVASTATDKQIALAYTSGRSFGITAENDEEARDLALRLARLSGKSVEVFHKNARDGYVILQANHVSDRVWRTWQRLAYLGVTQLDLAASALAGPMNDGASPLSGGY